MPQFRKKPVVIEAFQLPANIKDADFAMYPQWLLDAYAAGWVLIVGNSMQINTLEGAMSAIPGDWIIKGVAGELYPCKPNIFEATYEPV